MDTLKKDALNPIKALLDAEHLSVLDALKDGQPYAGLVAVAAVISMAVDEGTLVSRFQDVIHVGMGS